MARTSYAKKTESQSNASRYAQFSFTVDLLKNILWLIIGKKEKEEKVV